MHKNSICFVGCLSRKSGNCYFTFRQGLRFHCISKGDVNSSCFLLCFHGPHWCGAVCTPLDLKDLPSSWLLIGHNPKVCTVINHVGIAHHQMSHPRTECCSISCDGKRLSCKTTYREQFQLSFLFINDNLFPSTDQNCI